MYAIAIFGLFIISVSVLMIAKPDLWVEMAVRYCHLPYMHPLEILICLGFGLPFIFYAENSEFSTRAFLWTVVTLYLIWWRVFGPFRQ